MTIDLDKAEWLFVLGALDRESARLHGEMIRFIARNERSFERECVEDALRVVEAARRKVVGHLYPEDPAPGQVAAWT